MTQHDLKTWPSFFQEIIARRKTFEIRKNDRDFCVGDALLLKEWNPNGEDKNSEDPFKRNAGYYTGQSARVLVTYIFHGGKYGVSDDTCVMAIKLKELNPT